MSADNHPATPRSMTLMAGPIDPRESPTEVNEFAVSKSLAWFEQSVISTVPWRYAGGGRKVYPGFLQLMGFMAMNMERHRTPTRNSMIISQPAKSRPLKRSRRSMTSISPYSTSPKNSTSRPSTGFSTRPNLATGDFTYHGDKVDPGLIRRTALLTVEGGRDDICALGQTAAAHDLCHSLRPHLKRHHLQANVGHYGVFNGRRWENEIYPVVRNHILAME
jgi:poly(3-hydroxybutyrate) depolymerase